jgi:hypothetical protein
MSVLARKPRGVETGEDRAADGVVARPLRELPVV